MPNIGSAELVIILLLILVLFGAKRLPDSARSLGRSMRIFKAETKGLRDSDPVIEPTDKVTPEPLPPAVPPSMPVAPPTPAAPVTPVTEQQRPPQQ